MELVRVVLDHGKDEFITRINGTREEIARYYRIGNLLNMGIEKDLMREITTVEFLGTV